MTKKRQSRPNISTEALERAKRELAQEGPVVATPPPTAARPGAGQAAAKPKAEGRSENVVVRSVSLKKRTMSADELAKEYSYVIKDMRSMALLAFSLFIGMVVVSLILSQAV